MNTAPLRSSEAPAVSPGSVLVDVIAMLEVTVAIMDMVHMVAVGDCLAAVSLHVCSAVIGVHCLLAMTLIAVKVIDVIAVLYGLAPVARVVLVSDWLYVGSHLSSWLSR